MIPPAVTESDTKSGISGAGKSKARYARIPWDVLIDPRLKSRDVRIYGLLAAAAFQGTSAQVGTRRMANIASCSLRDVARSLNLLARCGHIEKSDTKRGRRAIYTLTSPVFGQKQRSGEQEIISSPTRTPRLASVRTA